MREYLRLIKYLRPYWKELAAASVFMWIFALANGAFAYLAGPAVALLFLPDGAAGSFKYMPQGVLNLDRQSMMIVVPAFLVIAAALKGISAFVNIYYMSYVGQRVTFDLRKDLYARIIRMPMSYFASNQSGAIVSRIIADVNLVQRAATDTLTTAIRQIFTIIVLVVVIFAMDWKLAVTAFIALPIVVGPVLKIGRKVKESVKKGQKSVGKMSAVLHEAIAGVRIVKAFGMEEYEGKRLERENEEYTKHVLRTIRTRGIAGPLMEIGATAGLALTIWYAAYRISHGTLKPEDLLSFFAAVAMLFRPIKALSGVQFNIQQGMAAASRVFEAMDMEAEPFAEDGKKTLGAVKDSIEFKGVRFGYGGKEVIKGIDLKVKKGERLAIVGGSGAGKTTFVNLIPRFYDPSSGKILVDGEDVKEFSLLSLRENVSIVSQDVVLFNDTVGNNIAYGGRREASADVEAAARAANAHAFIERMPEGYDTVIGERGMRLSGGERQRLSIARAILKNAPILIMDEATSSLDAESERDVEEGLRNLMFGKTTFVIAHRLSTIINADRIIVLKDGRIMETGRHEELLALGGEYARLYKLQFRDEEEDGRSREA